MNKRLALTICCCLLALIACTPPKPESPVMEEVAEPTATPEPPVATLAVPDPNMQLAIDPQGHSARVQDVMFTPDGRQIVSVSNDKTIRIWETETGTLLKTIRGQIGAGDEGKIYAGALSPDGRVLAIGGYLGQPDQDVGSGELFDSPDKLTKFSFLLGHIRLIDLESGEPLAILKGHTNVVLDLAFSADGTRLASASADDTVRIWDVADAGSPALLAILEGHAGNVYDVDFAPDRTQVVSASADGTLRLWDVPAELSLEDSIEGVAYQEMQHHEGGVRSVAFAPNGDYIISGGTDGSLALWDGDGQFLSELERYPGNAATVAFSVDGSQIVVAGTGTFEARVYAIPSGERLATFGEHTNSVLASAFLGNGLIATGGADNTIYAWKAESGILQARMAGRGNTVWAVAFGDGLRLAFGNTDGSPDNFSGIPQDYPNYFPLEKSFDFAAMALDRTPPAEEAFTRARTGDLLHEITLRPPHELQIAPETIIANNRSEDGLIRAFTLTDDGSVVVGSSFSLKLYTPRGELLREFSGHVGEVFSVSVSRDGRVLASSGDDQTIRLWNLATGECLAVLFVASDNEWICWMPQGYYAASDRGGRYVGWHENQGVERAAKFYPAAMFQRLFFHPDIVSSAIRYGSTGYALTDFVQTFPGIVKQYPIADLQPPRVEWLSPQEQVAKSAADSYRIQARVSAAESQRITTIEILVNDVPQPLSQELEYKGPELSYSKEFETLLSLPEARNAITISASTEFTQTLSEKRVIDVVPQDDTAGDSQPQPLPDDALEIPEKRLALVIGNAAYQSGGNLPNPVNDARRIDDTLQRLGFEVMRYENVSQQDMKRAIDAFGRALIGYEVGLFYYSGHGVQVDGQNYLMPVDANLQSQYDVEYQCVDAGRVFAKMEAAESETNIIVLDACRDNPFENAWTKSVGNQGLAFMDSPSGSLIAYATAPGKVAFDDPQQRNSIYTAALLRHIVTPDITIIEMFQRVRATVMEHTADAQTPWESTSLTGNFYFLKHAGRE